jgi:uncharacterized protein
VSKRVIFDTNVWVSYFIGGRFEEITHLIFDHDLIVLTSPELITELSEVLTRKKFVKYLTLPIIEYIDFHIELTEQVETVPSYTQSPDPKDNFLFDLAIQHQAAYLVTGDRKLQAMDRVDRTDVVSPSAFLALLTNTLK